MNIDDRLKEAFQAKAATAQTSPEAFELIRDRVRAGRRLWLLQVAGATLAVPAIAVAMFATADKDSGTPPAQTSTTTATTRTAEPTPAPTPTPTPTGSPTGAGTASAVATPAPAASATPEPSPSATGSLAATAVPPAPGKTPTAAEYADAIAVRRAGGAIDVITPAGAVLKRIDDFVGQEVGDLEWSPNRTELWIGVRPTPPDTEQKCTEAEAVAVSVRTGEQRTLGPWTQFAFSADGEQFAAVVQPPSCAPVQLLVGTVATGEGRTIAGARAGTDEAQYGYSSLSWVPGANRLVFIEHGLGESVDARLLDLETAQRITDGVHLDDGNDGSGEGVTAATYLGRRLVMSLECCVHSSERVRFVARDGTGKVTELFKIAGAGSNAVDASPDGTSIAFITNGPLDESTGQYGTPRLRVWSGAGDPQVVKDGVTRVAW
jgi:hypothetical protein